MIVQHSAAINRVHQTLLIRETKASSTFGYDPLEMLEADELLTDRIRNYLTDGHHLADPQVGRFYVTLGVDHILLEILQARILAKYTDAQLLNMPLE